MYLIENDEGLPRFDRLPFVLGDALDEAIDIVGWPVEQGTCPSKIGLEVQLHETVLEQLAAHTFGEHGLARLGLRMVRSLVDKPECAAADDAQIEPIP